jgi:tRNA pseudouridine38-40 synthase
VTVPRYFFRVEYNGTAYHGWQRQPNGNTVQAELERALGTVARQTCEVVGAGRTDAGVHARGQGVHVDLDGELDLSALERSVNAVLPRDIAIRSLQPVDSQFHARYSAVQRQYKYRIARHRAPLSDSTVWVTTYPVDWEKVRGEIPALMGTHDFTTFCASGSDTETAVCCVSEALLAVSEDQWVFSLVANRFVYKMVRSIVGTLVEIGRGACVDSLADILASRDRERAGPTAPPWGLVLENVVYHGVSE